MEGRRSSVMVSLQRGAKQTGDETFGKAFLYRKRVLFGL